MKTNSSDRLANWLSHIVVAVLCLLPFHAFLTTWLGGNFGAIDTWRIWKELIIFAMVPFVVWLAYNQTMLLTWLRKSWLPKLLVAYLALLLMSGLWALKTGNVNDQALIYGLLANLRFFGFFAICLTLATYSKQLHSKWWKIILIPAVIVITFGLLQLFLPLNFLSHFGYGPDTIPAFQTVDQKLDYRRIQSTLRGANPFGAYLVLVIVAIIGWTTKKRWHRYAILAGALVALGLTYSRSAWLGMLGGFVVMCWSRIRLYAARHKTTISGGLIALVAALFLMAPLLVDVNIIQNVLFHSDETSSSSISSNAGRTLSLRKSAIEVVLEPLGQGVGTAGPASFRNNHAPRISENYFLQIGQESGWLAILLFVSINILVAKMLWAQRHDARARVMFATLAGLTIVNMVSHAWMDDTLSLLFWGLAGIVLSDAILKTERITNKHAPKKQN